MYNILKGFRFKTAFHWSRTVICRTADARLTPFQLQTNHSQFRIINSQWHALFCIDHDHIKWRVKDFLSSQRFKPILVKLFYFLII